MNLDRVLIVDGDARHCQVLCRYFEKNGLRIRSVYTAAQAYEEVRVFKPHAILIEVCLPGGGITFCRRLHADAATSDIPKILMTGLIVPDDLLDAAAISLGMGPIYIKTRDRSNLLARIKQSCAIFCGRKMHRDKCRISIDSLAQRISINGREIAGLPSRRFQLLCALLSKTGPISRKELLAVVWKSRDNVNVVDVTIHRLCHDLRRFSEVHIQRTAEGYFLKTHKLRRIPA